MSKRDPLPDEIRLSIETAIREGGTCRGIARDHKVSPSTVSKIAKEAGLTEAFNRTQTAKATTAHTFDSKAARTQAVEDLYGDFQRFRKRAWEQYTQVFTGPQGPELITTKMPPLRDQQAAYTAAAICLDKAAMLERHDQEDGSAAGKSMVNDLFGALNMAYHKMVTEEAINVETGEAEARKPEVTL